MGDDGDVQLGTFTKPCKNTRKDLSGILSGILVRWHHWIDPVSVGPLWCFDRHGEASAQPGDGPGEEGHYEGGEFHCWEAPLDQQFLLLEMDGKWPF